MAAKKRAKTTAKQALEKLKQELREGRVREVYLFWGEEVFLIQEAIRQIKQVCLDERSAELDYKYLDGRDGSGKIDWAELFNEARMPSFFSERRLILIRASQLFLNGKVDEKHESAIESILDGKATGATFIFWEDSIDQRKVRVKKLPESVFREEFSVLEQSDLSAWIRAYLKRYDLKISSTATDYLIELCERRLLLLSQELKKLSLYARDEEITQLEMSDVERLCPLSLTHSVFEIFDVIARKETDRVIELYRELRQNKEAAQSILIRLAGQLKHLMMASSAGRPEILAEEAGVHPYRSRQLCLQAKAFRLEELKRFYTACLVCDEGIKTGKVQEDLALEQLLIALAQRT